MRHHRSSPAAPRAALPLFACLCVSASIVGQSRPDAGQDSAPQGAGGASSVDLEAVRDGDIDSLIRLSRQKLTAREAKYGRDHHRSVDERLSIRTLEALREKGPDARRDFAGGLRKLRDARHRGARDDHEGARALLEEAIGSLERALGSKNTFVLTAQAELGLALYNLARPREAVPVLRRTLEGRLEVLGEAHPQTATTLHNLAAALARTGDNAGAVPLYERALAIRARVLGDADPKTTSTRRQLALCQLGLGRLDEARAGCERALATLEANPRAEVEDVILACNDLGLVVGEQADYSRAVELLERALALSSEAGLDDRVMTATIHTNLGKFLNAKGEIIEAHVHFEKAVKLLTRLRGARHVDVAVPLNNLAYSFERLGDYDAAEVRFRQAIGILVDALGKDHPQLAVMWGNVASVLYMKGELARAEVLLEESLALSLRLVGDSHPSISLALNNLATVRTTQGKHAEARELFERALLNFRRTLGDDHPKTALSLVNAADNLRSLGRYEESRKLAEQALEIYRESLGDEHAETARCLVVLGQISHDQGRREEGVRLASKAVAIYEKRLGPEHLLTTRARMDLAVGLDRLGRRVEARTQHRKSIAILEKIGPVHPLTVSCYRNLGLSLHDDGRYDEALEALRQSVARYERARHLIARTGLEQSEYRFGRSLDDLAALLSRLERPVEAFEELEASRGRGLRHELAMRSARRLAPEERKREAELTRDVTSAEQALRKLEATGTAPPTELRDARRRLALAVGGLEELRAGLATSHGAVEGKAYSLVEIQAALAADAALVAWIDTERHPHSRTPDGEHWGLVLRSSGAPVWTRLEGSGTNGRWTDADIELPSRLATALRSPTADTRQTFASDRDSLRKQRLAPLERHLAKTDSLPAARHLIVLPSPALRDVPLAILDDDFTFSYAPSGSVLAEVRRRASRNRRRLLAVGDASGAKAPTRPDRVRGLGGSRQRLPGARCEAVSVGGLFTRRGGSAKILLGPEASEADLRELEQRGKLREFSHLLFSTHGTPHRQRAFESALELARVGISDPSVDFLHEREPIDGRLTAAEVVRGWQLDADAVVLSACESAIGRYAEGEGYLGFAQAFLLAGARSVILTLWKVDDAATALLVHRFFENLLERGASKSAALHEAQRWLRSLVHADVARAAKRIRLRWKRPGGRPDEEHGAAKRPFEDPYYWAAFVLIGNWE